MPIIIYADGRVEMESAISQSSSNGEPKFKYHDSKASSPAAIRDYDEAFISAIQGKWWNLIGQLPESLRSPGRVVVDFTLHGDGTVSDVVVKKSDIEPLLVDLAKKAVLESAPFNAWSKEMRDLIKSSRRSIRFTFEYSGRPRPENARNE